MKLIKNMIIPFHKSKKMIVHKKWGDMQIFRPLQQVTEKTGQSYELQVQYSTTTGQWRSCEIRKIMFWVGLQIGIQQTSRPIRILYGTFLNDKYGNPLYSSIRHIIIYIIHRHIYKNIVFSFVHRHIHNNIVSFSQVCLTKNRSA